MRFRRSRRNRWIFGVCGGAAYEYGWNPTVVRIVLVLLTIFAPGPGWLLPIAYLLLGILLPESDEF